MAVMTVQISIKARWRVTPLMHLCKVAAYTKLLREKHVDALANFIVDYGYKITSR